MMFARDYQLNFKILYRHKQILKNSYAIDSVESEEKKKELKH